MVVVYIYIYFFFWGGGGGGGGVGQCRYLATKSPYFGKLFYLVNY